MPWQTFPGLAGKVYVPEDTKTGKKHPCKDCFACQNCGEERCRICRRDKRGALCSCSQGKEINP